MNTKKMPYELLIRWNDNGNLSGIHAQFKYIIFDDDDNKITDSLGQAEPLNIEHETMLSLLSKAQKDAMLEYESLKLQVKTLQEIILNNENTISLLKDSLITKEE